MVESFDTIFSVDCKEGQRTVRRDISKLILTPRNLATFYEKARKYPVLFGKPISNEQEFLSYFVHFNRYNEPEVNGLLWVDQDFTTVCYIHNIMLRECDIHYTFLDGRQRGRDVLAKKMIEHVFQAFQFARLNTQIPVYAVAALVFARKLGFVEEGRKRKCCLWKGEYYDEIQFGLLRDEFQV